MRPWHFEKLVAEALDELPRRFRRRLRNIAVVVESEPPQELLKAMGLWPHGTLLGLYQGVPLTERGFNYGNVLPDRITIFQKPIEAMCRTRDELKEAVKDTVKHEIGHYFGLDDDQLEELMEG
ncbi:MAG: metallopeptidase family protein [Candidatus Entotheonellia bacterium]